jgi:hypothetical protein
MEGGMKERLKYAKVVDAGDEVADGEMGRRRRREWGGREDRKARFICAFLVVPSHFFSLLIFLVPLIIFKIIVKIYKIIGCI